MVMRAEHFSLNYIAEMIQPLKILLGSCARGCLEPETVEVD